MVQQQPKHVNRVKAAGIFGKNVAVEFFSGVEISGAVMLDRLFKLRRV